VRPLRELTEPELRRRTSVKWRAHPADVLPLFIAEMDTPLAPAVRRALEEATTTGDTGYALGEDYVEALREFAHDRWGWQPGAARIVPDVMQGVVEMLRLVTAEGDAVVVNPPVYPPFYDFVSAAGRRVVEAPLGDDGRLDLDVLEATFHDARPTSYLLCSPHNPTGTVHTRPELEAVAGLAERYGVRVVVDEIHAPLVYGDHAFVPYLSVDPRALSLLSASKAWNLAGLKAAVAVAGSEAEEDLKRMPDVVTHGASHLGEIAHVAALRHSRDWLDALLVDLDENRRLLAALLAEHLPQVRYRMPEGTYLAWLDCRALDLGDRPAETFLTRARVALTEGMDFGGAAGAGHARLTLATTPEILEQSVRRLAASLVEPTPLVEPVETTQRPSRNHEGDATEPATPLNLLFVCTANICRSSFAETYAHHLLGDDPSVTVSSAGTHGREDEPIDHTIGQTLVDRGVDASAFRSRRLTPAMVEAADLVLTAERSHRRFVLDDHPGAFRKTFTLGQFARLLDELPEDLRGHALLRQAARNARSAQSEDDVADPFRRGAEVAEETATRLISLLDRVLPRLSARVQ